MSQHSQGRNSKNTQTDAEQISICAGLFFDRHASNTEKRGQPKTRESHVKKNKNKTQLFKLNVNRRGEKSI